MPEILATAIMASCFLALFGLGELLFRFAGMQVEHTRKIVHFGTGVLCLLFPLVLVNHWLVLFLCACFLLILWLSLRFNLLESINGIERISRGSMLYPIVVYLVYLVFSNLGNLVYFYLPILVLALCDPLAALLGKKWPLGPYKIANERKTLMGSSAFFVSSFALSFFLLQFFTGLTIGSSLFLCVLIAFFSSLSEGLSSKGYDNLFIPLVVLGVLMLYNLFQTL